MKIMSMGLTRAGEPIAGSRSDESLADAVLEGLSRQPGLVSSSAEVSPFTLAFRAHQYEAKRRVDDHADPLAAGWTYLIKADDPRRAELEEAIMPLALFRGMEAPARCLLFEGKDPTTWVSWLVDSLLCLDKRPSYILIVGGPDQVPFAFQTLLQTVAMVGRVAFDRVADLVAYVSKVIRLASATAPVTDRSAIVFGPDGGLGDSTYFSRRYMVDPIACKLEEELGFDVHRCFDEDATKTQLEAAFASTRPALVYSASHGIGAIDEPPEVQRKWNGGVCCRRVSERFEDDVFAARDVPLEKPFLEGAVFFQFACYGYGTPARSEYAQWIDGMPASNGCPDFVAELPTRLLANPHGPIAYVGHLDVAFLHAFVDVEHPRIARRWHGRLAPFLNAIDRLAALQPTSYALGAMSKRYAMYNALLTTYHGKRIADEKKSQLVDCWISRGDAQNYMVLGDPAAALRLPAAVD